MITSLIRAVYFLRLISENTAVTSAGHAQDIIYILLYALHILDKRGMLELYTWKEKIF